MRIDINETVLPTTKKDMVNHPPHYIKHPSGIECKDVIKYFDACSAQAIKYIWRHEHKGSSIEDLKKAMFWINERIQMLEEKK